MIKNELELKINDKSKTITGEIMTVTFSTNCGDPKYAFLQNEEEIKTGKIKQYEIVNLENSLTPYYGAIGERDLNSNRLISTLADLKAKILELACPIINGTPLEMELVKIPAQSGSSEDLYCDIEIDNKDLNAGTLINCKTLAQLKVSSAATVQIVPSAEPTVTPTAAPSAEPTVTPTAAPSAEPTVTPTAAPSAEPTISTRIPAASSNSYVILGTGIALVACISYIAYKSIMKRTTSDSSKKSTSVLPMTQNLNPPKVSKISPNRIEPSKTFSNQRTSFLKV